MNNYSFCRFEAKMQAKESMRQTRPSPLLVTLVYMVLTIGLAMLVNRALFDPVAYIQEYLGLNYEIEEILVHLATHYMSQMLVASGVSLLIGIYRMVMSYGYVSYSLRMARNEQPSFVNLFDGFMKAGRVIWLEVLRRLFIVLWILPFFALAAVFTAWAYLSETAGLLFLAALAYFGGLILACVKAYSYRLGYYVLVDTPEATALQAITRSKELMRGWKKDLFVLDLSFLGWNLVTGLTAGLLLIWLLPYEGAAEANFYDIVSTPRGGWEEEGEDPQLPPTWNNGPEPF